MKRFFYILSVIVLFLLETNETVSGQKNIENQISDSLTAIANYYTTVGKITVIGFTAKNNLITVNASDKFSYIPFRPENVKRIYNAISVATAKKYSGYFITCYVENRRIEDLIPNFFNTTHLDESRQFNVPLLTHPLVLNSSRPYDISSGLQNRHIALWQSHGWYYSQKRARWEWQRPREFTTVEDLYTQSYVLPYLVPMLEKAGANVLLPRERDTQLNEVVVDNDSKENNSRYREQCEWKKWQNGDLPGFANTKKAYLQGENPFYFGTYREIPSITNPDELSKAEWFPNMPEAGKYAVYVSYKSLPNSATDAHYTVIHKGIRTEFSVNQTMSGGTWLYLGHFQFDKGRNNLNKVVLTNLSTDEDKVITADAVKFGGGMGNIARNPFVNDSVFNPKQIDSVKFHSMAIKPLPVYVPEISQRPRYTEGARYWLQWAGMPDSVYSRTKAQNDYSDDFQSRGFWVNYLAGGTSILPATKGLGVPIDLALAVHSDAGATLGDSIVGTLGICTVKNTAGNYVFANGISRWASRDLVDIVQSQIVADLRRTISPEWSRRGMWNKSYSESRVPEVPTMLLELLSHQNFADMRYGLDPRFRFTVSRSIYKGVLRYLSVANKTNFVVQPLPVEQFSCRFVDKNKLQLRWKAVTDSLEPTAIPDKYVLYTRIDDGDFDNGVLINANEIILSLQPGKIYSFKITALNSGGESFPSEVLSACKMPNSKPEVLVINGFNRVCAPTSFVIDSTYAGFLNDIDAGVPYMSDISFVGKQIDFKRNSIWKSDEAPGFGGSNSNFETKEIAGNTFDYPFIHGKAIKAAGYSFVSSSDKAVLNGDIMLNNYKSVDLILGKQKQTFVGNAKKTPDFKTFPLALQQSLENYCQQGGSLFVSGAYIGSDLCESINSQPSERLFLEKVLKFRYQTSHASTGGGVKVVSSPLRVFRKMDFSYFNQPNSEAYYVESPDAIEPVVDESYCICRFTENNRSTAVAYAGLYKVCSFGFPFEAIQLEKDRNVLMDEILTFLNGEK